MAYMVARVATRLSQDFDVVDAWPWTKVLRTSLALDELDRVEGIRRDGELVELAVRVGVAMSKEGGQELARLRYAIRQRGTLVIRDDEVAQQEERGRQMMAKLARVERRRRRRGTV